MSEESKIRVFVMPDNRRVEVDADDVDYIIYKGMRPRLMDYEDFKVIRRILKKELARYLKGQLVFVSKIAGRRGSRTYRKEKK